LTGQTNSCKQNVELQMASHLSSKMPGTSLERLTNQRHGAVTTGPAMKGYPWIP
jgi:hypothetical protein